MKQSRTNFRSGAHARRSDPIFERTLDALPDGVLLVGADRRIIYMNPAFIEQWGFPAAYCDKGIEAEMLNHASRQLINPEEFKLEVDRIHATDESSQDEILFKDGRVFARRSVPFHIDEEFEARIWIFTDVTAARFSLLDPLSGVPNRRAYSQEFPRFVEAADDGLLKCVALLDIDNFKAYNDLYGHAAGDNVLKHIAGMLTAKLGKPDDRVFRIGGEEFLLTCRVRRNEEADGIFEDVRNSIERAGIPHSGNPQHDVVSASIGLSVFSGASRPTEVFNGVDAALYRAKSAGRNTVQRAAA